MVNIIKDPLGNEIVIHQIIRDINEHISQSDDVLDDLSVVIEKPMMILKMKEGPTVLYYLRAIGWNKTMLIGVQKVNDVFEVSNYEIDPPIERINKLHGRGERLM